MGVFQSKPAEVAEESEVVQGFTTDMPPKRKGPPLEDYVFALSGNFSADKHTQDSLEKLITDLGGTVTKTVANSTTHLCCSLKDYNANAGKVAQAKKKGLPLVGASWIIACEKKNKAVPLKGHLWDNLSALTAAADAIKINGDSNGISATTNGHNGTSSAKNVRKRGAAAVVAASPSNAAVADDEKDTQPPTKKTKGDSAKEDVDMTGNKVVAEGQFIKKKDRSIPIDEHCPLTTFQVYVDASTDMIYDASLNQSNATANNNKFYRVQVIVDPITKTYNTWTRWGRVGELGQSATLGDGSLPGAIRQFEKKFKDKSGLKWEDRGADPKPGKYAFVERNYNDDSEDEDSDIAKATEGNGREGKPETRVPDCTLEQPVKSLMELIFNQQYFQANMSSLNYDANKMPLGKLSKATITRGFQQLKNLAAIMDDQSLAIKDYQMSFPAAVEHLSNTYYSLIPHDFGRNPPSIINNNPLLKREIELLESLSDMKEAADIMKLDREGPKVHPLDSQFLGLGLREMTVIDRQSQEFASLSAYLNGSKGATHHYSYRVQEIFRIERTGEKERFEQSPFAKIASDRRLLWHGSRCTNFGGILSQGLRIAPPEAPVSGYMFGKGIYLADMSSKSAGYCAHTMSGGEALLLLCEAELGAPMQELTHASSNAGTTAKQKGMASTWGKGRTGPNKWIDAGLLHPSLNGVKMPDTSVVPDDTGVHNTGLFYNEYICYDVAQVKLRYLFRVKM